MKTIAGYLKITFVIFATVLVSSCATLTEDIEVETYADPDVDYTAYKTYAWAGSAQIVFDPIGQWEQPTLDTDEEVRFVINRELRSRGFIPVDHDPDMLVAFAAGIDIAALELREKPGTEKPILANVPKAALVVALVDSSSGYIVWLGQATGDVQQQQTIENIRTRIDYAVREIFKSYHH